ncbi:hypothetical protein A0H81_08814 [Grifola frondosa]|uniref:F-box domain-containing protein n=1 Tax=Grifola frondosa TaxID=5627 RepID=A0A1C7M514_GRIFR|nr:hypothetical protein A0H81_08814 [Grifola frondosa]
MSTCRTLNHAGVRHLLDFDVHLDSTRRIESFYAFMLAQVPIRYRFLRQLSLSGSHRHLSSESINQLTEILTHASRLEVLHLHRDSDLLNLEHHLQAACSSLTSLKEFHIFSEMKPVSGSNGPLYKMVQQMQSSLVKAWLRFPISGDGIRPDPAVLLHHSSATLEDLTVAGVRFQFELQFPRVRKLSISGSHRPRDLHQLSFFGRSESTSNQYRQLNRSVQHAGGGWKSLDRVVGEPVNLYRLGLTCQIRRVKISYVDHGTREMVAHILSDSRPSRVHIGLNSVFPCVRCIPDEVAARLTYLRCTIDLAYFNGNSDDIDTFQLLVQRSPLTHFMLEFDINLSGMTRGVMFLLEFCPDLFASQIIASNPSIRYIVIKVKEVESFTKTLFWKVLTMENGEVVVDKAPKEDLSVVMEL